MNHPLFELLARLDLARYRYTLHRDRPDTVRVDVTLVGERLEIDVFDDGHMEVSRFKGSEAVEGGCEFAYQIITENEKADS